MLQSVESVFENFVKRNRYTPQIRDRRLGATQPNSSPASITKMLTHPSPIAAPRRTHEQKQTQNALPIDALKEYFYIDQEKLKGINSLSFHFVKQLMKEYQKQLTLLTAPMPVVALIVPAQTTGEFAAILPPSAPTGSAPAPITALKL